MGWQDDPVVGGAPAWASDPVVNTSADTQRDLAKATTPGQAFTIGAGRMGDRLWEGVKQGGYGVGAILSELLPDRLKQVAQDALTQKLLAQEKQQTDNTARYKPLQEEHPVTTTLGESAPLVAAPMLRVVEGAGAIPAMVNAATSAAVPAMAEYGTAGERAGRGGTAAVGGAFGSGVISAGAKVLKPVQNLLTPEQQRLAGVAEDAGINLSAGQKTGNKFLQTLESTFESLPTTSATATAEKQAQRTALTKAVMSRLGMDASEATDQTLGQARGKIGGDFDRIFSKVDVPLAPPEVMQSLGSVVQDANRNLVPEQARLVANRADDLLSKVDADGNVPGAAYQAWRSVVQKQAAGAQGSLKDSLRDLYRAVDGSAYDAAGKVGEADNLVQARARYRDLLTAEAAMKNVTDGLMPAGTLLSAANKTGTDGMVDLARSAKAFVKDQIPNSGTQPRALAQTLATGGLGGGVGLGAYMATGDPHVAAEYGLGAAGAKIAGQFILPKVMQAAMNSGAGQRYLTQGVGRELSPLEQALMDRAVRVGAVSNARQLVGQ